MMEDVDKSENSEDRHFLFLFFPLALLTVGGHSSLQDN